MVIFVFDQISCQFALKSFLPFVLLSYLEWPRYCRKTTGARWLAIINQLVFRLDSSAKPYDSTFRTQKYSAEIVAAKKDLKEKINNHRHIGHLLCAHWWRCAVVGYF